MASKSTIITSEEFECEFCSLEFRTRDAWNNHIIQHFKQRNCAVCGKILIRVGDIWYGPHNSQMCDQEIMTTEIITEVQNTEEIILPDFIEVKAEEIYDVVDDESDIDDNDIFDEVLTNSDDDEVVTQQVAAAPRRSTVPQRTTALQQSASVSASASRQSTDEPQPYSMKQLKKDVKLQTKNVKKAGETQLTLTEDQLQSRVCPICNKMIVNKQNLICHINIHNGVKPFVCPVCKKSFAHIRNLVRHKEQQRHFDTEFKCKVKGCKKTFMTTNKLSRHEKTAHSAYNDSDCGTADRPYACAHCDKAFFTPGFLKMHLRLCHSGS